MKWIRLFERMGDCDGFYEFFRIQKTCTLLLMEANQVQVHMSQQQQNDPIILSYVFRPSFPR